MKSLFSFQGTTRRGRFWLGVLLLDVVAFLTYLAAVLFWFLTSSNVVMSLFVVLMVPLAWVFLALLVKRLRDAGLSPWLCPLIFVPLVGLVVFLIAGFKPTAVERTDAP